MAKLTNSQIAFTLRRARESLGDKLRKLYVDESRSPDLSDAVKAQQIEEGVASFEVGLFKAEKKRAGGLGYGFRHLSCFAYRRPAKMIAALYALEAQAERHRQGKIKVDTLLSELEVKLVLGDSDEAKAALAAIESVTL